MKDEKDIMHELLEANRPVLDDLMDELIEKYACTLTAYIRADKRKDPDIPFDVVFNEVSYEIKLSADRCLSHIYEMMKEAGLAQD